jgi:hypothetical protein
VVCAFFSQLPQCFSVYNVPLYSIRQLLPFKCGGQEDLEEELGVSSCGQRFSFWLRDGAIDINEGREQFSTTVAK